jgi:hypothetical protein
MQMVSPLIPLDVPEDGGMSDEFWPIERPGTAMRDVPGIADYTVGAPFWTLWLD